MPGHGAHRAPAAPRAPGRHLLKRRFVEELVDDARVGSGELVVDLGAGTGRITHALRRRGARVLAVELDAVLVARLRRSVGDDEAVTVVEGDVRVVPLPHELHRVIANLPFAGSGAILDRLLDPRSALDRADLVVEWAAARRRTEVWPATSRAVIAGAFFEVAIERRLPAACFEPRPSVDAAVLVARRRPRPQIDPHDAAAFAAFVRAGFAAPRLVDGLRAHVAPRRLRRLADELAFPRDAPARLLDGRQWVSLFEQAGRPERSRRGDRGR